VFNGSNDRGRYIMQTQLVDTGLVQAATLLRERAASLRAQAAMLTAPLAAAYRRHASELELEAWITEVQAGVPDDRLQVA
jgi:hypothetical protein